MTSKLAAPDLGVVTEPTCQLVSIGDASNPSQQRHVVGGGLLVLGEAGQRSQPGGDHRREQDVPLRLAQPKVGGKRQRGDQFHKPHA